MAQDDKDVAATNVKLESAGQNVEKNDYFSQAIEQYEKRIYDLQQMLEITRSLCSTVELNTLIESILYVTMAQMRALAAGVFILNTDDGFDLGNNFSGFELDPSLSFVSGTGQGLYAQGTQGASACRRPSESEDIGKPPCNAYNTAHLKEPHERNPCAW